MGLPENLRYEYTKDVRRLGNRPLAARSVSTYEDLFKQMFAYCSMKGDYESLLMLMLPCGTDGVPSMKVSTVEEFLRLKRTAKNTELVDADGEPVLDVLGGQIYCDGGWNAPAKANQLSTAISDMHEAHKQIGAYMEPCHECMRLPVEKKRDGCDKHLNMPKVHRSGNPTTDPLFKNSLRKSRKDGANWIERGDSQLLPSDLLLLRTHLLSSNSITGLQTWCIVIIAVKLFLRPDEVLSLRVDSIQQDLIIWKDGHCHSVTFQVMGKCDWQNVHLVAWADDDNPDLCTICPLLLYLHLSGIKSGCLFPKEKELHAEVCGETKQKKAGKNKIYRSPDGAFLHPLQ